MDQVHLYFNRAHNPPGQPDLVQEWFIGKALQHYNTIVRTNPELVDIILHEKLLSEYQKLRNSTQTSLSARVVSLMVFDDSSVRKIAPELDQVTVKDPLSGAILLNWDEFTIDKLIQGSNELLMEENQDEMFVQCARYIQPIALTVHDKLFGQILNNSPDKFMDMYNAHFRILGQSHVSL
jgi:hypothetical protein